MPANTAPPSAKKKGRRARLIVIVLVLALVAGVGYGAYWGVGTVRASFPQTTGSLQLKGLAGPVEVRRDSYGVPQIYADSDADLFRAQGFVQAQDRFWEMDVRRHMTAGRLSEMFGAGQVKTDAFLRTLDWRGVAQREYETKLSDETRKNLQAYADGVNAYLEGRDGRDISVEYAALDFMNDYRPAKWTPVDSVAWLKAMAWDLRGNMQDEIDRSLLTSRLSEKQIGELYPSYPYDRNKPIVSEGGIDPITGKYDPEAEPSATVPGGTGTDPGTGTGAGTDAGLDTGTGIGTGTDIGTEGSVGTVLNSADTTGTSATGTAVTTAAATGTPATAAATGTADAGGTATTDATGVSAATATENANSRFEALSGTLDEIPALLGPGGSGVGSNSWVVSGRYTTTGKPLLANDPHLAPQLPSLWYQMGLHCRSVSKTCQYDVAGYTFSGMPGVVIGHNQDIAWGFTNLGADVTDLYLEKVDGDSYLYGDSQKPFKLREEIIKVAGGKSKKITVRSTDRGPVISDRDTELAKVGEKAPVGDVAPDRGDGYAVSLQWTALQPGKSMDAVFGLNKAEDFTQFRKAAENFEVPSQNLIYADNKGHIGYQAPGRIPIRAQGDGRMPAPGWDPRYQWKGYIPFDQLPYEYDPERGYIVTANQAVVDAKKYPYPLTEDWGYGARSQRINDLIESKIKDGGKISTDDMQTMQMDNSSQIAKLLAPILVKLDVKDPSVREAQKLLEGWDYTQEPDSGAAAYFNAVWRNVLRLAFGNKLPKEVRVKGQCLSVRPADSTGPLDDLDQRVRECGQRSPESAQPDGGDRWYEVVRRILDDEDNAWWSVPASRRDTAGTTRDELLQRAMADARWELTAKLGKDVSSWTWGRLHQLTLDNQTLGTSGPGFLKRILNRGPWNLGGGEAAVNATGWNATGGYEVTWVPSMRMVVNVGDWDKSRWINLTGASGHAYSTHYTDQTSKWAKGELLGWSYGDDAVKRATADTLTLTP